MAQVVQSHRRQDGLVVSGVDRLDGAAHEGAGHVGEAWVREYPATLIPQAEAIWSHPLTEVQVRNDGTAWCVLPLRTMDEAPSDLSAELEIDEQGRVTISDVHVLWLRSIIGMTARTAAGANVAHADVGRLLAGHETLMTCIF